MIERHQQFLELSAFLEVRRKAYDVTVNDLCETSHISKKTYVAFRRGQRSRTTLNWFFRMMNGFRQILDDEEEFRRFWGSIIDTI